MKMYPKFKKMKKVPANCSSTPQIQDHLKTNNALITDISVKSNKHKLLQRFAKYDPNTASEGCIGPKILLQVNNELDMILCKITAEQK